MTDTINAQAIKTALALVHKEERTSRNPNGMTRLQAVEHALRTGPRLTHLETDILLGALHVDRTELKGEV
jgi:hypothetical protein